MNMITQIKVDRKSRTSLHIQIKNQIQEMIYNDLMPEGKRLPPTRKLAQSLGVNRSTVVSAYNDLLAEGLIEARVGRGTVVRRKNFIGEKSVIMQPLNWSEFFNTPVGTVHDLLIRDTIAWCSQEDIISLGAGVPSPDFFPVDKFQGIINRLLNEHGKEIFQYLPTEGYYPLREILARWMIQEGKPISPDEVLIVAGSIQGLYLISRTLLAPGDLVVMESPTFLGALQAFRAAGARIMSIPVDEEGIRVDILENLLSRQNPKFIYTLPTFQNPSGVVLSLERRKELLELAHKYQVAIIEDDPYSKLYYESVPPPSLKSLDKYNYVIYLGTFSKILFPGLRTGWVSASKQVIERLTWGKQLIDLHSNALGQYAIYEFCKDELLERHLERVRSVYSQKRDTMIAALKNYCSSLMTWNRPEGGFYLWCRLSEGLSSRELLRELFSEKVGFIAGEAFFQEGEGKEWLRLNFTFQSEELIKEGIKRLCRALGRLKKTSKAKIEREKSLTKPIV